MYYGCSVHVHVHRAGEQLLANSAAAGTTTTPSTCQQCGAHFTTSHDYVQHVTTVCTSSQFAAGGADDGDFIVVGWQLLNIFTIAMLFL